MRLARRRASALAFAIGTLSASSSLHAQNADSRWELGVLPTVRHLATGLAGTNVWSAGASVAARANLVSHFSLEAAVGAGSAPQLNFRTSALMNEMTASLNGVFEPLAHHAFTPYVFGGIGYNTFKYDQPAATYSASSSFTTQTAGAGLRWRLSPIASARVEGGMEHGSVGTSTVIRTGLQLSLRSRASAPAPVAHVAPRIDTVHVIDTLVVNKVVVQHDTVVRRDTLRMRDTMLVVEKHTETIIKSDPNAILVLKDASFDFAKAHLREDAMRALDNMAAQLAAPSNTIRIRIVGHTDAIGNADNNYKLGLARANAVVDYLAQHGVARDRMEAASAGKDQPIASNATEAGRQANRRVVISRN